MPIQQVTCEMKIPTSAWPPPHLCLGALHEQAQMNALTKQQNKAATGDAASVFLFALPLGSAFGADVEGELAQAKGEAMALQGAVSINCKQPYLKSLVKPSLF